MVVVLVNQRNLLVTVTLFKNLIGAHVKQLKKNNMSPKFKSELHNWKRKKESFRK